MMNHETWLTASQAKEKGLVDAVMFEEKEVNAPLVAGPLFALPTEEQLNRVKEMLKQADICDKKDNAYLMQMQLNLLKLKGERK